MINMQANPILICTFLFQITSFRHTHAHMKEGERSTKHKNHVHYFSFGCLATTRLYAEEQ